MDSVEASAEAQKIEDGVRTLITFIKREPTEQVLILREGLDKEIGSDKGALFPTIPGVPIPAAFVETMTDPLLDMFAKLMLKVLFGIAAEETTDETPTGG